MVNERDLLLTVLACAEGVCENVLVSTSPEAAAALHKLEDAVHNFRLWQIYGNEIEQPSMVSTRPCQFCGAPFFFAQAPTGAWWPLEVETIDAAETIPTWRYVVNFDAYPPRVTTAPTKEAGQVYVDHRQVCGNGDGPNHHISAYLRRHKRNVERTRGVQDSLVRELKAMERHLRTPDVEGE